MLSLQRVKTEGVIEPYSLLRLSYCQRTYKKDGIRKMIKGNKCQSKKPNTKSINVQIKHVRLQLLLFSSFMPQKYKKNYKGKYFNITVAKAALAK